MISLLMKKGLISGVDDHQKLSKRIVICEGEQKGGRGKDYQGFAILEDSQWSDSREAKIKQYKIIER